MSCSLRRGALAASALVFSLLSLTACAAGNSAATNSVRPDNAATSAGDIKLQNINVVTQPEGAEGPASVTGKIFNTGDEAETLESVKLAGTKARVELSPAKGSGPLVVPAHGSLILGGKGNASAVVADGRAESVRDGDAQRVVFTFSETGDVRITAFVQPNSGYYKDFGPSAEPTQSASLLPTGTASPSATEGATGEATNGTENAGSTEDAGNGAEAGSSATADEHTGH